MTPRTGPALIVAGVVLVVGGLVGGFVFAEESGDEVETASTTTTTVTTTTTTVTTTTFDRASLIDHEAVAAFYGVFVDAVHVHDVGTLIDRLHPVVFELFGEEQCLDFVGQRFNNPELSMEVVEVGPPETWTWEIDGRTVDVDDTVTVTLIQIEEVDGAPATMEVHLALDGDDVAWFTDCGDPI
ncbi:hypothetical protein [Actinospongicola halichondriae]|uniref:hypothetical protein n=1 Tax=Actinospongicola halichondriae TaxID=3236844 RepID=UPI003D56D86E